MKLAGIRLGFLFAASFLLATQTAAHEVEVNVTIPDFPVRKADSYLCTYVKLPERPYKLVGIEPLAKQEVVHHILLFGCDTPAREGTGDAPAVWECNSTPACREGSGTILYGWGKNAPPLQLPDGVGFSVGGATGIQYIVAQVHYLDPRPAGDHSGVRLYLKPHAVQYSAGLLSFASYFSIPPRQTSVHVKNSCCYQGFEPLTPFAVRVHTHSMGRAVFMTRPHANGSGLDVLANGDPQMPQGFNPTPKSTLYPGDRLTVTCDFDSSNMTRAVQAGPTHQHEMCNMYMMVYSRIPHLSMCDDGAVSGLDDRPGTMNGRGKFLTDPSPQWQPPRADSKSGEGSFGQPTSVAVAPDGTLWVLYRSSRVWDTSTFDSAHKLAAYHDPIQEDTVVQLDSDTGRVLRRWGRGHFYLPHMITVDRDNNVWIADTGMHMVFKFTVEGKLLRSWGTKLQPGSGGDGFCQPTHVAVLNDGSFVVGDGYCNRRVARFDSTGKYTGEASLDDMFVVHSVIVHECTGVLYVADRQRRRVHSFSLHDNRVLATWDMSQHGRVWALRTGPYGSVLAMTWEKGQDAKLVNVHFPDKQWVLPGLKDKFPHDIALGAASVALSGAGEPMFALYVTPLCQGCGPLQKLVLFPPGFELPVNGTVPHMPAGPAAPAKRQPVVLPAAEHHHHHGPGEVHVDPAGHVHKDGETQQQAEDAPASAVVESIQQEIGNLSLASHGSHQSHSGHNLIVTRPPAEAPAWLHIFQIVAACTVLAGFIGTFAFVMFRKYNTPRPAPPDVPEGKAGGARAVEEESGFLEDLEKAERTALLNGSRR